MPMFTAGASLSIPMVGIDAVFCIQDIYHLK